MAIARGVCPRFSLAEEQKSTINDLFLWAMNLPGRLDPQKGIWLWGSIGSGKSTLLRVIERFLVYRRSIGVEEDLRPKIWLSIRSAIDLTDIYSEEGPAGISALSRLNRLAIDDLGTESRVSSYYGIPCNVVADVLLRRYDIQRDLLHQTYVTSNFSPEQVGQAYGDRVFDRCGDMFNFVQFSGKTHRSKI